MSERFLTRHEAAEMMRLEYRTLGNLAAQRRGPPFVKTSRFTGKCLYRESDIVAYLQGNASAEVSSSKATSSPAKSKSTPAKARSPRRRKTASTG